MLEEGIKTKNYTKCNDSIIKALRSYQNFLLKHFKHHEFHSTIRLTLNQSAHFFATAKTHKFISLSDITPSDIKLRLIIDQTGMFFYQTGKLLAGYLKPLADNRYTLKNTQLFPELINKLSLYEIIKRMSVITWNLFTKFPIDFTIKYIRDQIYSHKKLPLL